MVVGHSVNIGSWARGGFLGQEPEFLTVRKAARRHSFSAAWLRNEIREGRLPAFQRGTRWMWVYEPELIAHLRSMRVTPANADQAEQARRRVLEIMKGGK